jgi:hypothetical protein
LIEAAGRAQPERQQQTVIDQFPRQFPKNFRNAHGVASLHYMRIVSTVAGVLGLIGDSGVASETSGTGSESTLDARAPGLASSLFRWRGGSAQWFSQLCT